MTPQELSVGQFGPLLAFRPDLKGFPTFQRIRNVQRSNWSVARWAPLLGALWLGAALPGATVAWGADKENAGKPTPAAAAEDKDAWRQHGKLGVFTGEAPEGVKILGVMPGSPAERAGVKEGDILRRINGERMHTPQELSDEISDFKPGEQVEIIVRRNGERVTMKATLAARASLATKAPQPSNDQLIQQIRLLQQQVSNLQRQFSQPRSAPADPNSGSNGGVLNNRSSSGGGQWWGSGSQDDDPDLFQ